VYKILHLLNCKRKKLRLHRTSFPLNLILLWRKVIMLPWFNIKWKILLKMWNKLLVTLINNSNLRIC